MHLFRTLLVFIMYNLVEISVSTAKTNSRLIDRAFMSYQQSADKKLNLNQQIRYMPSAIFYMNKNDHCVQTSQTNAQNEIETYINQIP